MSNPEEELVRAVSARGRTAREPTDATLVMAARSGNRAAGEALFRRHAPFAYRFAGRLLRRDQDVADVAQASLTTAFASLRLLRDPDRFASWLGGIVLQKARVNAKRRRRDDERQAPDQEHEAPICSAVYDASPALVAELALLLDHVAELPEKARLSLLLHRVEGYTLPEVAAALGASVSTVARLVRQATGAMHRWA